MFESKTVIVLGAGASWHYNQPTGEQLVIDVKNFAIRLRDYLDQLTTLYAARTIIEQKLGGRNKFRDDLLNIIKKLDQIAPLVIDYFLGHNPEIAELGKLLIACVLLEREADFLKNQKNLNRPDANATSHKDDWGRFVVQGLLAGYRKPTDLMRNNIRFVTFNYDLSLERRLFEALSSIDSLRERDLPREFLNNGRIIHIYGKIREDYFSNPNTSPLSEDPIARLGQILIAAVSASTGIKTIAPIEKQRDEGVDAARKILMEAEFIYFLGYGFDRTNNEVIGLQGLRSSKQKKTMFFTNLNNLNKVGKSVALTFAIPENDILGSNHSASAMNHHQTGVTFFRIEKSIHNVYDALAFDFDWPI